MVLDVRHGSGHDMMNLAKSPGTIAKPYNASY